MSRVLGVVLAVGMGIVAILAMPIVAGPLLTSDGSIDGRWLPTIMWSIAAGLAAAAALSALWAASPPLLRAVFRPGHLLAAMVIVPLAGGAFWWWKNSFDLGAHLAADEPAVQEIAVAPDPAAAWVAHVRARPRPSSLPPYPLWEGQAQDRARHVVAGRLGAPWGMDLTWHPGEPLDWGGVDPRLAFQLQRQAIVLDLVASEPEVPGSLEVGRALANRWATDNLGWPSFAEYVWNDDTMSQRIQAHMWLMEALRERGVTTSEEELRFARSLVTHGTHLMEPDEHNFQTNHGLMQNAALLDLAATYPELDRDDRWRAQAVAWTESYIREAVHEDGTFREFSPGYHLYATRKLTWMVLRAREAGVDLGPVVESRLRGMFRVARALLLPDGSLPLIGDTHPGVVDLSGWPLDRVGWPEADALLRAEPARNAGHDLLGEAYLILRGPGSVATLLLGPESRAHVHADKLSVHLFAGGRTVVSGPGYVSFMDYERYKGIAAENQSVVTVVGRRHAGGSVETTFVDLDGPVVGAQGTSRLIEGVSWRRALLQGPAPDAWLVVDELDVDDGGEVEVDLRWGAGPGLEPSEGGALQDAGTGRTVFEIQSFDEQGARLQSRGDGRVVALRGRVRGAAVFVTTLGRDPGARVDVRGDRLVWTVSGSAVELPLRLRSGSEAVLLDQP